MHVPDSQRPHGTEPVLVSPAPSTPRSALILLHGRGASAESISALTTHLALPSDTLVLAPQAANSTWYPYRFIEPQSANQPELDSALARISSLLTHLGKVASLAPEQIVIAGFSQGACLTAEFLKRHPQRYQGAAIMSGGLIGTDAEALVDISGNLTDTPIYIGCDDTDHHIPLERVKATSDYLTQHGGAVSEHIYINLGHTIHADAITFLNEVLN